MSWPKDSSTLDTLGNRGERLQRGPKMWDDPKNNHSHFPGGSSTFTDATGWGYTLRVQPSPGLNWHLLSRLLQNPFGLTL